MTNFFGDEADMYKERITQETWNDALLPQMSTIRQGCAAVAVGRQIIVCGGYGGTEHLSSVETITFPGTGLSDRKRPTTTWTPLPNMTKARFEFGAAVVSGLAVPQDATTATSVPASDVVFVAGGQNENGAELFDLATNTWTELPPMNEQRWACAVTSHGVMKGGGNPDGDGKVYVVGGYDKGTYLDSIYCYDTALQKNASMLNSLPTRMNQPRANFSAVMLQHKDEGNNLAPLLVCVGNETGSGDSAESYNFQTGKWTDLPPMKVSRCRCAAVAVGPCVFVIGGGSDTVEYFDFRTHEWTLLPNRLSVVRSGCAAVAADEYIVVVGGRSDSSCVEVLKVGKPSLWMKFPSLPTIPSNTVGPVARPAALEKWCAALESVVSQVKSNVANIKDGVTKYKEGKIKLAEEEYEKNVKAAKELRQERVVAAEEEAQRRITECDDLIANIEEQLRLGKEELLIFQQARGSKTP